MSTVMARAQPNTSQSIGKWLARHGFEVFPAIYGLWVLAGIGQGFRDSNLWLAVITNNALSASFYVGDALGSFNSWMRFITGLLAGLGIVWFVFPYVFYKEALERN
jgi:hypothetical protein